jgi:hypothetical protein
MAPFLFHKHKDQKCMKQNARESDAAFCTFMEEWNKREGRTTPELHIKIAEWLERNWDTEPKRLLLMAFRGGGKSTIAALFSAWLLYINPDLRILVLAADARLAGKMAQQIRKIIERHPLTSDLKPTKKEQWSGSRFTVKRDTALRDPSVQACGITMNITGSHADVIICDDVEVPKTCATQEQRENLRERLSEIDYILGPGGTQLYIGTPHTYYSIYADHPRAEIDEKKIFLDGFERLEIPVLNETGESAWPDKFTPEAIDQIAEQSGPNKFASQMMLRAVNIVDARLDPSLLNIYDDELDYAKELELLFLGRKKLVSASGWWDPAYGSAKGDNSVFAAAFTDGEGNYYLHHIEYLKITNESDRATAQCRRVTELAKKLYLPSLTIENNGIGQFLPGILKNEIVRGKASCAVIEFTSTKPKDLRILEAFDALLAARKIHVHTSVLRTPFMIEMQEWRPGRSKSRDDGLDAAAGALSQQPVRIKRIYGDGGRQGWTRGAVIYKAKTEFKV